MLRKFLILAALSCLVFLSCGTALHRNHASLDPAARQCRSAACTNKFIVLSLFDEAQRQQKTISGMYAGDARIFEPHWWSGSPRGATIWDQFVGHVEQETGELVGIAEFRFTSSDGDRQYADLDRLADLIEQKVWNRGGIPGISDHFPNPWNGEDGRNKDIGEFDDLFQPGTQAYERFHRELDVLAEGLSTLRDRDIPVLFRPFHEDTGGWFWWGSQTLRDAQFKQLWHYTVNYMEEEKGLDHLVWVYGPSTSNAEKIRDRYPGDDEVHVVGVSNYRCNPGDVDAVESYEIFKEVAPSKPFAFTELGPDRDGRCEDDYNAQLMDTIETKIPNLLYFLNWYGPRASLALYPDADRVINHRRILNAHDLLRMRDRRLD